MPLSAHLVFLFFFNGLSGYLGISLVFSGNLPVFFIVNKKFLFKGSDFIALHPKSHGFQISFSLVVLISTFALLSLLRLKTQQS